MNKVTTKALTALVGVAVAGALIGCAAQSAPTATGDDSPETSTLSVGYVATLAGLPLLVAAQEGFFEEEGLDVTLVPNTDITKFYPALGSQYQFAAGTPGDFLNAAARGIDVRVASGNVSATEDSKCAAINARPDIASVEDLDGATVGLAALGGVLNASLNYTVDESGLDAERDVAIIAVPMPNMVDQLAAGAVDAVVSVEPFTTQLVQAGYPVVEDPMLTAFGSYPFPCHFYTTSGPWAQDNPNTVGAFQRAIAASIAWIAAHEDETRALIESELKLPAAVASGVTLPAFTTDISDEDLAAWVPVIESLPDAPEMPDTSGLVIPAGT